MQILLGTDLFGEAWRTRVEMMNQLLQRSESQEIVTRLSVLATTSLCPMNSYYLKYPLPH